MQQAVKAAKAVNHNGHPLRSGVPVEARGVSEVDRLSCCAFVFMDEAAEDVAAVELPRCG
jgi:hypothetical protein